MKRLSTLAIAGIVALTAFVTTAHATRTPDKRLDLIERAQVTASIDTSATTYASKKFVVIAPFKGYVTALRCVNEITSAAQGITPTVVTPKLGAVSLTALANTFVSGTASGGIIAATQGIVSGSAVSKNDPVELKLTGQTTNGGAARCFVEFAPNYY